MFRPTFRLITAGLLLVAAAGCASVQTTQSSAVGANRSQFMTSLVSESEVEKAAAQNYTEILSEAKGSRALNTDAKLTQRVRAISNRLIAQVPVLRPDAANWQWQVNVIDSDEVNAWCMPGGRMAVYSGFIKAVKPTDDELAAVMGHEIAHALREHTREKMSQQMATSLGLSVLSAVTGTNLTGDLGGTLTNVMFTLPNSRQFESEADAIGVELAARAGFDPRAAVTLWQKMGALGGSTPELLSTHPSPATRIADLEQKSALAMPLYEQARGGKSSTSAATPTTAVPFVAPRAGGMQRKQ